MFRDEIEITYRYSHVSRRERQTQIEFLKVEREKYQSILADLWRLLPLQVVFSENAPGSNALQSFAVPDADEALQVHELETFHIQMKRTQRDHL